MLVEIGTGKVVKGGLSPFGVTFLSWSKDGRFLYVGTKQGRLLVCECEEEIRENILDATDLIKDNYFFWDRFKLGKE